MPSRRASTAVLGLLLACLLAACGTDQGLDGVAPAAGADPAGDGGPDLISPATPVPPQPKHDPAAPPSSPSPTYPPPPDGSPPVCDPGALEVRLDGADAFTGHRLLGVAVRNVGDGPCSLIGYPELAFRASSGELVDAAVTAGDPFGATDLGPRHLVLDAGAEAYAIAGWDAMSTTLDPDVTVAVLLVPPGAANPAELPVASIPGFAPGDSLDVLDGAEVTVTAWAPRIEDLL